MDIGSFSISGIPRIVFGRGRAEEIPEIAASFGRKALIVVGRGSFQASPHWKRLIEQMGSAGLTWEIANVTGEPSPNLVDSIVGAYRQSGVDVVIGIGGGSVLDAAKAIAGLLPSGNSVMDHIEDVGQGIPYSGPATPFIAAPTTAGTGSEATKNAVLSAQGADGFKKSFRSDLLVPKVAVVDPALTDGCPPDVTAASGMDALTQLIESYTSTKANPFTDALAMSGTKAFKDGFLPAWRGEPEGRDLMAYAALISGITLAQVGLGVVHGLASPLGAYFPVPHNVACGVLLAPAIRANIAALQERAPESPALEKYGRLGMLLADRLPGSLTAACDVLIDRLSALSAQLKLPKLSDYGVTEADIPKIVAECAQKTNPIALTDDEVAEILWEGLGAGG